jgi:hypothetical protein
MYAGLFQRLECAQMGKAARPTTAEGNTIFVQCVH